MDVLVRNASLLDVDYIIEQLKAFSKFYGTKYNLFEDLEYIKQVLPVLIQDHVFLIAERDGIGPIGFISGSIVNHPYNPNLKVLNESFWWIAEEYRMSRAGLMLLNEFIRIGKEKCQWIIMVLENKSPVNESTLLKRGFVLQERSFLMEV